MIFSLEYIIRDTNQSLSAHHDPPTIKRFQIIDYLPYIVLYILYYDSMRRVWTSKNIVPFHDTNVFLYFHVITPKEMYYTLFIFLNMMF